MIHRHRHVWNGLVATAKSAGDVLVAGCTICLATKVETRWYSGQEIKAKVVILPDPRPYRARRPYA